MKEETQSKQNPFILFSGQCTSVGANSEKEDAIKIVNSNNKNLRLHSFVLRYKDGLDDCTIDISSSNIRKTGRIIVGDLSLGVAGAKYGTNGFSGFPLLGKKPVLNSNDTLTVKLKTHGIAIDSRDVSIAFLAEEVEG